MEKFKIIDFPHFSDNRGETIPFEFDESFPFEVRRVYVVTGKENQVRGGHAHQEELEVFVAISGQVSAMVNDGSGDRVVILNQKSKGLLVRPHCWHEFSGFSENTILLCFSSIHFDDREGYLDNKDSFLKEFGSQSQTSS